MQVFKAEGRCICFLLLTLVSKVSNYVSWSTEAKVFFLEAMLVTNVMHRPIASGTPLPRRCRYASGGVCGGGPGGVHGASKANCSGGANNNSGGV